MAASEELFLLQPEHFSGVARLFPLPNLVLFPHVLQPLHVFEPRYRALVEEAMAADRLIAMALLEPGWEPDYDGRPPVSGIACLGRITTAQRRSSCTTISIRPAAPCSGRWRSAAWSKLFGVRFPTCPKPASNSTNCW